MSRPGWALYSFLQHSSGSGSAPRIFCSHGQLLSHGLAWYESGLSQNSTITLESTKISCCSGNNLTCHNRGSFVDYPKTIRYVIGTGGPQISRHLMLSEGIILVWSFSSGDTKQETGCLLRDLSSCIKAQAVLRRAILRLVLHIHS